ncbi:hypothetical protein [Cruoricaptor ignavus]|nr:hypothetical protein [Cruoricaptor ignavus]
MKMPLATLAASMMMLCCTANPRENPSEKKAAVQNSQYEESKAKTITLKLGENQFVQEAEMNITFLRLVQDSRCPENVNCVHAGNATIELELMATYSRPIKVQLSTSDDKAKEQFSSASFNGNLITLTNLKPTKNADGKINGLYSATLKIEKGETKQPVIVR